MENSIWFARKQTVISSLNTPVDPKTDKNPNGVQIANNWLECESKPILFSDIKHISADLFK